MTKEDFKIEIIYLWEKHKDDFIHILSTLALPFLFPIFLIIFILFPPIDDEEIDQDIKWCKDHKKEYPKTIYPEEAHSIIKKWKKEFEREEKRIKKELIRKRLRRHGE
jgi:hypothetical protein